MVDAAFGTGKHSEAVRERKGLGRRGARRYAGRRFGGSDVSRRRRVAVVTVAAVSSMGFSNRSRGFQQPKLSSWSSSSGGARAGAIGTTSEVKPLRRKYGVRAVPYTLVLGADGHAREALRGAQDEGTPRRRCRDFACTTESDCTGFADMRTCDTVVGYCVPVACPAGRSETRFVFPRR